MANKTNAKVRSKVDMRKKQNGQGNGYKKLSEKHKEYLRRYVAKVLPKKESCTRAYMITYTWKKEYYRNSNKKKQAAVLANRVINTYGAKEYVDELQKKVLKTVEDEQVVRPIIEDLIILDRIIKHNAFGTERRSTGEKDKDGNLIYKERSNIELIPKQHTAIRAIEMKAKIMGESRIRLVGSEEKVTMSREVLNLKIEALRNKVKERGKDNEEHKGKAK